MYNLARRRLARVSCSLALLSLLFVLPVRADEPVSERDARALFEQGIAAADAGHWAEAVDAFERSRALVERPNTLFNLVSALYEVGHYTDGLRAASDYLRISDPRADAAKRTEVEALVETMSAAVGRVRVEVQPRGAEVRLDGTRADECAQGTCVLTADPGAHALEALAPGHDPFRRDFMLERGGLAEVRAQLLPSAVAPPPAVAVDEERVTKPAAESARVKRRRRALWVSAVTLVVGTVAALLVVTRSDNDTHGVMGGNTGLILPL